MKRSFLLLCTFFLLYSTNLMAEEFVPKHASFEKDGKRIELKDLSDYPVFYADYYPSESVVKIKAVQATLFLKRGFSFMVIAVNTKA